MENHNFFYGFVSTISTGPFSSSQTVSHYQAGYISSVQILSGTNEGTPFKADGTLENPMKRRWKLWEP